MNDRAAAGAFTTIDTEMHGRRGITGAFIVRGRRTALVETGPRSSLDVTLAGLSAASVEDLDWIVVTHIHLDHAGAAGSLAARFPGARVAVHEVGAPHLVDPSKLWSSAARIYGDRMNELWGGIDPISQERIHVLRDGDQIDLGGRRLRAIDTPGHARHHHAYLDDQSGTIFSGDALGVRLPDVGIMRPATPPPEFDLDVAIASIRRLSDLRPTSFCLTHFGPSGQGVRTADTTETCEQAIEALQTWAAWVREARERTSDLDEAALEVGRRSRDSYRGRLNEDALDRMEQTTSDWMNTWGYMRYYDKRGK